MNLRIDGIILLFDVLESLMHKIVGNTYSMIESSLIVDGDQIQNNNLRLFNLNIESFCSDSFN